MASRVFGARLPAGAAKVAASVAPLVGHGTKFAVVFFGKQSLKVAPGDLIMIPSLQAEVGSRISLTKVAMVGGHRFTAIGRPLLENAVVLADVEEQKRGKAPPFIHYMMGSKFLIWKDGDPHVAVLRIRSVEYNPELVGELDKYAGTLVPEAQFDPRKGPNPVHSLRSTIAPVAPGVKAFEYVNDPTAEFR